VGGRGRGLGVKGRWCGKGAEMTQTLYAHMNKRNTFIHKIINIGFKLYGV
jgi:hypothetical protein